MEDGPCNPLAHHLLASGPPYPFHEIESSAHEHQLIETHIVYISAPQKGDDDHPDAAHPSMLSFI
jgi:hypothetical protein